jgi:acyl-CoA reductase-like NAD-dependent aldehyde dehydrogenase
MKAITPHYIDGKIVEPHGRKVIDSINPTNNTVIGRVALADEEDAKRAIDSAKHRSNGRRFVFPCREGAPRTAPRSDVE